MTYTLAKLRIAQRIAVAVISGLATVTWVALMVIVGLALLAIPIGLFNIAGKFIFAQGYAEKQPLIAAHINAHAGVRHLGSSHFPDIKSSIGAVPRAPSTAS